MADALPQITEAEFTRQVLALLRVRGSRTIHMRPGRTARGWRTPVQADGVGWPDIFATRSHEALAAELKVGKGKATPSQIAWLDALESAGITVYLWRPEDFEKIMEVLQ